MNREAERAYDDTKMLIGSIKQYKEIFEKIKKLYSNQYYDDVLNHLDTFIESLESDLEIIKEEGE